MILPAFLLKQERQNMRIKIKKTLPFIQKKNLVEFDVNSVNGAFFLTTEKPKFKQLIKRSEYDAIIAAQVKEEATAKSVVKTMNATDDGKLVDSHKPKAGK